MPADRVVNIINFIRGCEPRSEVDLVTPVKKQLELADRYRFPATFLFQYDALVPEFTDIFKGRFSDEDLEFGLWFEIVEPLCEACGIEWRGRYPWDWHSHVGFPVGYPPEERIRMADEAMRRFREVFGRYPRSFGSWVTDTVTLAHLSDNYDMDAFCNCKEQWGTDGYTLWGGYPGGGYYPSRTSMLSPADTSIPGDMIKTPMFRMLGADPIYQYDFGLDSASGASGCQEVVSLEPIYWEDTGGGGVPAWVSWYFRETFSGRGISLAYAQTGQENSFGWDQMKNGLRDQFAKLDLMRRDGDVRILTLGETGREFSRKYSDTPNITVTALSDWKDPTDGGKKSVWFASSKYRANLLTDGSVPRFRDLYIFHMTDRYLTQVCDSSSQYFENFPVADGNRFSGHGILSGIYFRTVAGEKITFKDLEYSENGDNATVVLNGTAAGSIRILFMRDSLTVSAEKDFILSDEVDPKSPYLPSVLSVSEDETVFEYEKQRYSLKLEKCSFIQKDGMPVIASRNGTVTVRF